MPHAVITLYSRDFVQVLPERRHVAYVTKSSHCLRFKVIFFLFLKIKLNVVSKKLTQKNSGKET